jgi:hypothetical protein
MLELNKMVKHFVHFILAQAPQKMLAFTYPWQRISNSPKITPVTVEFGKK